MTETIQTAQSPQLTETAPRPRRQFGSDNYAGICPEAMEALIQANQGHVTAYGTDPYTQEASEAIRRVFETDCEVYFVFNGTAANATALAAICQPYHAIIAHELAHVEADECGAPEFFSNGAKLLLVPGAHGKVDLGQVERTVLKRTDIHYSRPKAVTIAQSTEMGTVYTPDEVRAVGELTRRLGLRFHMDGARLANAVASLGVAPAEITWRAGVDVLSFGMTKNGIAVGEAVVFFNKELGREFDYRCKQAGQLASKMRFLTAPWAVMLRDGVWLHYARQANRSAQRLAEVFRSVEGIEILFPVEANAVFVRMPAAVAAMLRERGWRFHDYPDVGGFRFMCAWDTTDEDIEALARDLKAAADTH